jgi:hypothetical protein
VKWVRSRHPGGTSGRGTSLSYYHSPPNFFLKKFFRFIRKVEYPSVLRKKISPPIYNTEYVAVQIKKSFLIKKHPTPTLLFLKNYSPLIFVKNH